MYKSQVHLQQAETETCILTKCMLTPKLWATAQQQGAQWAS